MLISADLFCCGLVTLMQSLGVTPYFGVRLPVMMGVTFAARRPDGGGRLSHPGGGGRAGDLRGADRRGVIVVFIAPVMGRLLRFFPPVVTGTIILIIGM